MSTDRMTFTFEFPFREPAPEFRDPWDVMENAAMEWPLIDRWGWRLRPLKSRRKRAKKVRNVTD